MAIVAISRGTHNGADEMASRLSGQLGYPYVGREQLVAAASTYYRIPLEEMQAAMDRRPSFWDRKLGAHIGFLPAMRATLAAQVSHDNLIYSGYAGHLLLPGIPHVLSVRVVADLEARAQAAMQREHISRAEALTRLESEDRKRWEWVRFLFGVDWTDVGLYHLVVNVSRLSQEAACAAVARLVECPEFQATAASRKVLEDLALYNRVLAALALDFRTRDAHLKVTVDDGVVTVTGTTRWAEVAEAVPEVVRNVEGVKRAKTEITGGEPPVGITGY